MSLPLPAEPKTSRMRGQIRRVETPLRHVPDGPAYTVRVCEDGRQVFLHREVLRDLAALELSAHPEETAGLLFGRIFTDGINECALVRHLVGPEPGEVIGTRATVTITAEGSRRMTARAATLHPCADPVGWAHTHPTFEAYFSATDRAEQAIWTSLASVGLVLSGLRAPRSPFQVFLGPDSTPTRPAKVLRPHRLETKRAEQEPFRVTPSPEAALPMPRQSAERRHDASRTRRERIVVGLAALLVLASLVWLATGGASEPGRGLAPGARPGASASSHAAATIDSARRQLYSAIEEARELVPAASDPLIEGE